MTQQRIPIDQVTRDRVRTELDRNMVVEAGAGTGKTTIMVSRVVEIIRTGRAAIDELVIITFTEKAAAELSTRVRESLERSWNEARDTDERLRLEAALTDIYRARIETIHAFASSLLRERPVEEELDPNFEVLDSLRAELSFDEQFRAWLNDYLGSDESEPLATIELRRALNRGLGLDQLRELCSILHGKRFVLPLVHPPVEDPDVFGFRELVSAEAEELAALLPAADPTDLGAIEIRKVLGQAERFRRAGNDRHRLERVILAAKGSGNRAGANGNWESAELNQKQKQIRIGLNEALAQIQFELRSSAVAAILPLAERFARDYELARRRAGQAEFEDLLIWARDLLRDKLDVRRDFQERFKCILVDEVQDTDPLQVEIVMFLASEDQGGKDWTQLEPSPGKLFVVGDPKQSIYRFRRADISIYEQVKNDVLTGNLEVIRQNFRSVPEVIDWVNGVFESLIQPVDRMQPEYIPLDSFVESNSPSHAPVVMIGSLEPPSNLGEIRREEARLLARAMRLGVELGNWQVRDSAGVRPATYGDIAILIPRRTGIEHYEGVFAEAGIPFRHEGGKEYFQRQEVRDLRAVLRAIDNPGDNLSIVNALRSNAFGYSDREIYVYLHSRPRESRNFDYRQHGLDRDQPLFEGMETLVQLHELRKSLTLPEIIEQTIERTNLVEFALTLPYGGDQSAANLLKMVDQARQFSAAGGGGLRAFVRWTVTSAESRPDEADAAVAESTDDVVRIMTIHAAKGLEFPIVALANLNGRRSNQGSVVVPNYQERRLAVQMGSKNNRFETPGFGEAKEFEDQHEDAEDLRLLYVAATRAADYLVLPVAVERNKANGLLKSLIGYLPELTGETRGHYVNGVHVLDPELLPPLESRQPEPEPPTDETVALAGQERSGWRQRRDAALSTGNRTFRIVTASSQKAWQRDVSSDASDEERQDREPEERGMPVRIGNALHGAVERIDLQNPVNVDALTDQALDEANIPRTNLDARHRVHRMVGRVLESAIVQRARASGQLVQEVEFAYGVHPAAEYDEGVVRGQMDLVFVEDGEIVVADFKSDRITGEEADDRTRKAYWGQAAVYAYAAHQTTGLPVREVIFVYAEPGQEVSLSGSELIERGQAIALAWSGETGTEIDQPASVAAAED